MVKILPFDSKWPNEKGNLKFEMVGERDKKLRDDEERRKMELYLARQDVLWQQNKVKYFESNSLSSKDAPQVKTCFKKVILQYSCKAKIIFA